MKMQGIAIKVLGGSVSRFHNEPGKVLPAVWGDQEHGRAAAEKRASELRVHGIEAYVVPIEFYSIQISEPPAADVPF